MLDGSTFAHLLDDHDALGLAELVASGQVSPAELAAATAHRVAERNPTLNAVVYQPGADASPPAEPGPFHGVPIMIKDLWASTANEPMHNGCRALKDANWTADEDGELMALYRAAGFHFAGRTNTPELGLVGTTEPLSHGPTRNPWNTNRGVGGSSGGSAAAVAAGMAPIAHASDGGGSIRIPASLCGLVGLKPSRGRIPMQPWGDEWGVSIQHIVSRSVRDSAAVLDVSSTLPPGAALVAPRPDAAFADFLDRPADPQRVIVTAEAVAADVQTHPACAALARHVGEVLESMGHMVGEGVPATFGDGGVSNDFLALWTARSAASLERMGAMIGRELGPDDVEPGTWKMAEHGRAATAVELLRAEAGQAEVRRSLQKWFAENCDILVTPTCADAAPVLGELQSSAADPHAGSRGSVRYATFTAPFNVSGQPAISLPMGMTDDGLPIGVQLVAAWGREDLLIQVAAALEAAEPWFDRRPVWSP